MIEANVSVVERNDCSSSDLSEELLVSDEPVVLRGLAADWPVVRHALSSTGELLDYILSFYNGSDVGCFKAAPESGGRFFYKDDMANLDFEKYMSKLDLFIKEVLVNKDSSGRGYCYSGSENVDRFLPGFSSENYFEPLRELNPRMNFWIGNQSRVAAHFDMPSNVACCVAGARRFILFPPDQVENLYPGSLDFTPSGQSISLVDFHNPDFDRFPKFKQALEHARVVDLQPGDALYLPGMWWHHVEGLSDVNILVNFWWWQGPSYIDMPVNALYYAMLNIKDLPVQQKRAWKQLFDYYVFNEDPMAFDHVPAQAQGRLAKVNEQSARYIRSMLINELNR